MNTYREHFKSDRRRLPLDENVVERLSGKELDEVPAGGIISVGLTVNLKACGGAQAPKEG